jgi:hypothetical protein
LDLGGWQVVAAQAWVASARSLLQSGLVHRGEGCEVKEWDIQAGLRVAADLDDNLTCDEMRKTIYYQSRDSALIANVLQQANARGLSGEDRYTILAFHALIQLESHWQRNLELTRLMPMPPTILKESDGN